MRGNRRWGVVKGFHDNPEGFELEHWIPRGNFGKQTVAACGMVMPFAFSFWYGTGAVRCQGCVRARKRATAHSETVSNVGTEQPDK